MVARLALSHLVPAEYPRVEIPRLPEKGEAFLVTGDVLHGFSASEVDETGPEPVVWVRIAEGAEGEILRARALDPIRMGNEEPFDDSDEEDALPSLPMPPVARA